MKAINLLRNAQPVDLENSKNVRVKDTKKNRRSRVKTNTGGAKVIRGGIKSVTHTMPGRNERKPGTRLRPRKHTQYVYPKDPKTKGRLSDVDVKVACDCQRHMYYYEVALHERGAADIIYSNGEPPYDTNPRLLASPCKHQVRVLSLIVSGRY